MVKFQIFMLTGSDNQCEISNKIMKSYNLHALIFVKAPLCLTNQSKKGPFDFNVSALFQMW